MNAGIKPWMLGLGCWMAAAAAVAQTGVNLSLRGGAIVPDRDDEWEVGGGMDFGIVFWPSPNVGFWVGGGGQGWSMEEESFWLDDGGWASIEGNVAVVPFGASLLLWGDLGDGLALLAEGGLRYAVVDSDATVESLRPYTSGRMALYEDPIEIDDTVLAVASLQFEYTVAPWIFGFGAGFQWDLVEPDQKLLGETFAETAFDAAFFFLSAGIAF